MISTESILAGHFDNSPSIPILVPVLGAMVLSLDTTANMTLRVVLLQDDGGVPRMDPYSQPGPPGDRVGR